MDRETALKVVEAAGEQIVPGKVLIARATNL